MEIKVYLNNDDLIFCIISKIHSFSRCKICDSKEFRYYKVLSKLYETSTISTNDIKFLESYLKKNTPTKRIRYKDKWWYANTLLNKAKKELENVKKIGGINNVH